MALVDASGTASGVGSATGACTLLFHSSGTGVGSSSIQGGFGLNLIFTGITSGEGSVAWDYLLEGAGTVVGSSTASGAGALWVNSPGYAEGSSRLAWSFPLPAQGTSFASAFAIVERHLPAVTAVLPAPKTFRYLQWFQKGDLPIFIRDARGPVSPVRISYTFFFVRLDGTRVQMGPKNRVPVKGDVGEFYASGRAGELGQPGSWVIRWEFQKDCGSVPQSNEMCFRVHDAVLAASCTDATVRVRKYGWE